MILASPFEKVFQLETTLGVSWPALHRAHAATSQLMVRLTDAVGQWTGENTAIVVLGSAGRYEVTEGSDLDWMFLVDGPVRAAHQEEALGVASEILRVHGKKPGREGLFGNIAFSHDLVQYVGGDDDLNSNLTRRILLLLESKAIGKTDAYTPVIRAILDQYLSNDHGFKHGSTHGVPRFLLNDVARYWRTVAVDYAYKRRTRNSEEWALRSAKLRLSRKLIYAAGLIYAFSLSEGVWPHGGFPKLEHKLQAIERLWELTSSTPLDLLAAGFMAAPALRGMAKETFTAYDEFLRILDNEELRGHLKALRTEDAGSDPVYQRVRELGAAFEKGLFALLIDPNETVYPDLVREYGLF